MIIVWRPRGIADRDFRRYVHCWERSAEAEVVVDELCDRQQALWWDRVNTIPGRRVVWVQPEFIPFPSLADELDLYQEEEQLVVVLQTYAALFNLGQDRPARWEPDGVSHAFVAFQLGGQRRWTLPRSAKADPWKWLAKNQRAHTYRLPQTYSGNASRGACSRSVLGEVVMSPWGGRGFGRLTTGGANWVDPKRQLETWRGMVEAWERFVK